MGFPQAICSFDHWWSNGVNARFQALKRLVEWMDWISLLTILEIHSNGFFRSSEISESFDVRLCLCRCAWLCASLRLCAVCALFMRVWRWTRNFPSVFRVLSHDVSLMSIQVLSQPIRSNLLKRTGRGAKHIQTFSWQNDLTTAQGALSNGEAGYLSWCTHMHMYLGLAVLWSWLYSRGAPCFDIGIRRHVSLNWRLMIASTQKAVVKCVGNVWKCPK